MAEEFFAGYDDLFKRPVSIRMVSKNISDRSEYARLVQQQKRLNHPNILAIYDFDGVRVVYEGVTGSRLSDFLRVGPNDRRAFSSSFEEQFLKQLVAGLQYAHEHEIVHRCLTPECIWLFPDGQLKIYGFGTAFLECTQGLPTAAALSTMAPEQARGEKCDRRSDVWAVGVILYLMEFGEYPFLGPTLPELVRQILQDDPPRPLRRLVAGCLKKDPSQRFQTMNSLLVIPEQPKARDGLIHHVLALAYYRQSKFSLAALEWDKACLADPLQPAYINNLGAAHWQDGQLEKAQDCFERGRNPFNQGLALHRSGEFTKAREALIAAVHQVPKNWAAYYLLGECLMELGKIHPAIEEFQKSLILRPASPESLEALGRAYESLGRTEEAQRYREQAEEQGSIQPVQPQIEGDDWTVPESLS